MPKLSSRKPGLALASHFTSRTWLKWHVLVLNLVSGDLAATAFVLCNAVLGLLCVEDTLVSRRPHAASKHNCDVAGIVILSHCGGLVLSGPLKHQLN